MTRADDEFPMAVRRMMEERRKAEMSAAGAASYNGDSAKAAAQSDDRGDRSEEPQPEVDRRYLELMSRLLDNKGLRSIPPPTPLVDGWLYRDTLAWIQGKWGNAKSFLAIDLGCCVATGTPWHGHEVAQGTVLYLIAEGASGLSQRVEAWEVPAATKPPESCSCPSRCRWPIPKDWTWSRSG